MNNLFIFSLAVVGLTNLLVDSTLFEPIRCWLQKRIPPGVYQVLECHQCTGFWCGLLCGLILVSFNPFVIFMCGCAGSFLSMFVYLLVELILSKTQFELPENQNEEVRPSL